MGVGPAYPVNSLANNSCDSRGNMERQSSRFRGSWNAEIASNPVGTADPFQFVRGASVGRAAAHAQASVPLAHAQRSPELMPPVELCRPSRAERTHSPVDGVSATVRSAASAAIIRRQGSSGSHSSGDGSGRSLRARPAQGGAGGDGGSGDKAQSSAGATLAPARVLDPKKRAELIRRMHQQQQQQEKRRKQKQSPVPSCPSGGGGGRGGSGRRSSRSGRDMLSLALRTSSQSLASSDHSRSNRSLSNCSISNRSLSDRSLAASAGGATRVRAAVVKRGRGGDEAGGQEGCIGDDRYGGDGIDASADDAGTDDDEYDDDDSDDDDDDDDDEDDNAGGGGDGGGGGGGSEDDDDDTDEDGTCTDDEDDEDARMTRDIHDSYLRHFGSYEQEGAAAAGDVPSDLGMGGVDHGGDDNDMAGLLDTEDAGGLSGGSDEEPEGGLWAFLNGRGGRQWGGVEPRARGVPRPWVEVDVLKS